MDKLSKEPKLSLKQRLFCQYYVETFGNGTEAVLRAGYNVCNKNGQPNRNLAKSIASENLTKPDILNYINILLEKSGLNDETVAAHHWFLINQFTDLSVKAKSIDLYYRLKGKYSAQKFNIDQKTTVSGSFNIDEKIIKRIAGN